MTATKQDLRAERAEMNTDEAIWLSVDLGEEPAAFVDAVRTAVESSLSTELTDADEPHVTLLFVGPVPDDDVEALKTEADEVAAVLPPFDVRPLSVETFPPGPDGRAPVFIAVEAEQLQDLHHRLMAALAPRVTAKQFPTYKAHVTLGYTTDAVDPDLLPVFDDALAEQPLFRADEVMIRRGGNSIGTAKLQGIAKRVEFRKVDEDRRLVTGVVLEPWDGDPATAKAFQDAQGDVVTAEEIERACHLFLREYNRTTRLGFMHQDGDAPLELCECWIARAPLEFELADGTIERVPAGTWLVTLYVADDAMWADVKAGDLDGLSLAGNGFRRPV